ncbi:Response regulator receiver modulated diguanylate cyclase/phosphodiesterase with PAS/PAC sensor(S) (modular protein) [Sterolibacterium denitrificans]|uniref:Response regulator receiver modulated diguanylate cyclase/phosphodiesterase with PAS/PAC sensor(S) (Modular protein) n=1 Tax=Sterolibacterium denitrificans TaxID=157592 RepID=A0A7Z7MWT5_9PROT|nr:EAL domain-containing protein [Sterolibacterium denitrificans]SMB32333.1 Response regulator receiver modulated diguanylate cyclase/phosphodiesterase with PAS/PAC sensor(S) (modular protein) [Sterolibacterium denitrificans]
MKRTRNSILILPLLVFILFFVVACFSLFYSDWLERKRLISETSVLALDEAGRLARQASYLTSGDVGALEQEILQLRADDSVTQALIVDATGRVLVARQHEWKGLKAPALIEGWSPAHFARIIQSSVADIRVDTEKMRITVLAPYGVSSAAAQTEDVRRGAVFLAHDLSGALERKRKSNFIQRLPDLGLVLLFAIGLAIWIYRSVVAPLRSITDASRRIGSGDLGARVPISDSGEVAELGNHFNSMAEALEHELTARSELSSELQQSYARLTRLTAHLPGIVYQFVMAPDGRFRMPFVSDGIFDKYGCTPEQLAQDATPLLDMVIPEDRAAFDASILESARTLQPWRHEFRIVFPNGDTVWHAGASRPERLDDGSIQWHGFFMDIADRKRSEESQRLSASVFETTGEAIMVTDVRGTIVMVNPAFCRITGYAETEVLGKAQQILSSGRHDHEFYRNVREILQTSGNWVGEIWSRRKNGEQYPEWQNISVVHDNAGNITHYVTVFADLTEIRSAQQEAENLSWRDPLTDLANRALFLRQIDQILASAQRDNGYAAILLIDIDRFKDINEARGLAMGDALLKAIADRLGRALRPDDMLARLNADEFAITLPRLSPTPEDAGREALAVAEKLRTILFESIEIDNETFHLDASIGIAVLPDGPEEASSDALRRADMAMHEAKAEGGARVVFFEAAMGDAVRERFRLERELRLAIGENQLRLYLQPQVDAAGLQVGCEALVRWQHPERGLVPPIMFIPLAESSELIVSLDRWMLAEVCRLLAQLKREGHPLRISVNISPRHFRREDFVDEVKRLLAASGADASYLVLEVTEGMVIGDVNDVIAKMNKLKEMGVQFSMDDFGTGYSSLAYLKRLPIHELKIDKGFIQDSTSDSNDAALVETILSVAQHMNLQVVAEGVETQEQADFLNARAKVIHQGYLFGRPEPVDTWLERHRA